MKKMICIFVCCLLVLSLALCCGCSSNEMVQVEPAPQTPDPVPTGPVGYKSAEPYGAGFMACGTGGRLDYIAIDGTVTTCETGTTENLNSVYCEGKNVLVAGDNGTLLRSTDGKTFEKVSIDTDATLFDAVAYNGAFFAATTDGTIYRQSADAWEPVKMETEKDIIDLAVYDYGIAAITAESDVCFSTDGVNWTHQDFNAVYDGLYPRYVFSRLIPAGETLFVLGYQEENPKHPLIMFTETGEVWQQKEMMKINGEYLDGEQDLQIHDICFNIDQIVSVLDGGRVISVTECSSCNEMVTLETEKNLWATAVQEAGVLVCGEDFFAQVLDSKQIRQDKIGAEQAQVDVEMYGALLIDVREDDELAADGYIPGSIHVPLAEVEARLPELAPDLDTEIIFYCASGKRSQTATEKAIEMGYTTVYNLGGLSDWPYEIVKDEAK